MSINESGNIVSNNLILKDPDAEKKFSISINDNVELCDEDNVLKLSGSSTAINESISGQTVGDIGATIKVEVNGTTYYLYGYTSEPSA